jgi:hypothetical protein
MNETNLTHTNKTPSSMHLALSLPTAPMKRNFISSFTLTPLAGRLAPNVCNTQTDISASHPGDRKDTDSYFLHCPEAAQPTVTFLSLVVERGGQLNSGSTLLHYRLLSTVYNASTRAAHTFPISAYFKNGQRWVNFPPLNINTYVFITGRIFGVTKENRQLAVIIDDIHFLPSPTLMQPMLNSPPSTTAKRKPLDRWSRRASPGTPSKAAHLQQSSQSSPTEAIRPTTFQLTYNPTEGETPDDNDKETHITWSDTTDENNSSPPLTTPTPNRRSKRPRKL